MSLSIILTTILSNFATSSPNLCDDVYVDTDGSPYTDSIGQMLSRYCVWTGPDAPVWDADVCCTIHVSFPGRYQRGQHVASSGWTAHLGRGDRRSGIRVACGRVM